MNGRKAKALRRKFKAVTGRDVNRTVIVEEGPEGVAYIPSEWRRLKSTYKEMRRG